MPRSLPVLAVLSGLFLGLGVLLPLHPLAHLHTAPAGHDDHSQVAATAVASNHAAMHESAERCARHPSPAAPSEAPAPAPHDDASDCPTCELMTSMAVTPPCPLHVEPATLIAILPLHALRCGSLPQLDQAPARGPPADLFISV